MIARIGRLLEDGAEKQGWRMVLCRVRGIINADLIGNWIAQ